MCKKVDAARAGEGEGPDDKRLAHKVARNMAGERRRGKKKVSANIRAYIKRLI